MHVPSLTIADARQMLTTAARDRADAGAMLQAARQQRDQVAAMEQPARERVASLEQHVHFESLASYDAFRMQLSELRDAESVLGPLADARQAWERVVTHAERQAARFAEADVPQGSADAVNGYRATGSVDPRMALARRAMELDGR